MDLSATDGVAIVQVIHVTDEESVHEAIRISHVVDALLLDSGNPRLAVKELEYCMKKLGFRGMEIGTNVAGSAARSTGQDASGDVIALDLDAPQFAGATVVDLVDRWIFSGNRNLVRSVDVAGARVVDGGRHRNRDEIAGRYRSAIKDLLA